MSAHRADQSPGSALPGLVLFMRHRDEADASCLAEVASVESSNAQVLRDTDPGGAAGTPEIPGNQIILAEDTGQAVCPPHQKVLKDCQKVPRLLLLDIREDISGQPEDILRKREIPVRAQTKPK